MSENQKLAILSKLYNRTSEAFGKDLIEVILYGSYARGDFDSESDMDIALIFDSDRSDFEKYDSALNSIMTDFSLNDDILLSLTCIPISDFEKYKKALPYYRNIDLEGVRLHA